MDNPDASPDSVPFTILFAVYPFRVDGLT
ncbi:unnamed protein product [Phytomonas sp. EM1]|nr:unnamed protein product [Phytomonas sp. EM1]|eukprot:CCW64980.1 unnamed protein product [Phytomonas sp. isolate EM1]